MRVQNKTIIITDPCYIAKDKDWGTKFDWCTNKINVPEISDYIWSETGHGDGSFDVLELEEISEDHIDDFFRELKIAEEKEDEDTYKSLFSLLKSIGEFSVDSGTMIVALYDEIFKYNSKFINEIPTPCYCIIKDFSGTIEVFKDENNTKHFLIKDDSPIKPLIITY